MQKIVPCLWFDSEAEAAARLYTSLFKNSSIGAIQLYGEAGPGPKGTAVTVAFKLEGYEFVGLNGGPLFRFTPAISFMVGCESKEEIDGMWQKLSEGGSVLMALDKYPFAERYGWVQDRFGVSWQLMQSHQEQKIMPCLLYVGKQVGRAEEAISYYVAAFPDSRVVSLNRYGKGQADKENLVAHAVFSLGGQHFVAMESSLDHKFTFTEAISLMVNCGPQEEVDHFWNTLSDGGEQVQCGWLKDKFGVSWQAVPTILGELMADKDPVKAERVMRAMLQMKKIDIAALKKAYEGK
jgi:predicted 3-demethylubiquinone-9 3-methyltransferase (glyoxalase superfamily)